MSDFYCIYKGREYPADIDDTGIEMTSTTYAEGFIPYVDVLGNKHPDIFIKTVKTKEIELLFSLKFLIKYQNEYFEPFSLSSKVLESGTVLLYTPSEEIAEKMDFTKREQFVFEKKIRLADIEEVKIIRKPVLMFKGIESTEEVIKKK